MHFYFHKLFSVLTSRFPLMILLTFFSQLSYAYFPESNVREIREGLKGKAIFFVGYPGSGKGTQGAILSKTLGIPHVSTGELFRIESEKLPKTAIGEVFKYYMDKGEIIPSEYTFPYLEAEFGKEDYRNGFILDGYPKDLECFKFILKTLREKNLELLSTLYFEISPEEAERRLLHRGQSSTEARNDDKPEVIKRRLVSFREKTMPLLPHYESLGVLRVVPAAQTPQEMTDRILNTLYFDILPKAPYFLNPVSPEKERSSRFHNHMDGRDHRVVRNMVREIEQKLSSAQNKIYPISFLQLGQQTQDPEFRSVYQQLPNFHPIENSRHESFSTGKMGDQDFDYEQMLTTLQVAFSHPHDGVMTEIEEDIFAMETDEIGRDSISLPPSTPHSIQWDRLPGLREYQNKMIAHVPEYELHHGFDIPKLPGEKTPPISLANLTERTRQKGFQTGGWFIFSKKDVWSYRTNEFSNQNFEKNLEILKAQARNLREIIQELKPKTDERKFTSSASLEKVHAIWRVE